MRTDLLDMLPDALITKHYHATQQALKTYRDKTRARDRVVEEGVSELEAQDLIDRVFHDNLCANRRLGMFGFMIAGTGVAIVVAIWLLTDRLFYIALPLAAIAAILGFVQFVFPSGYVITMPSDSARD